VQGSEPEEARSTVFAATGRLRAGAGRDQPDFQRDRRSEGIRRNASLAMLLALILTFFALLFGVPPLPDLFRFAPLDGEGIVWRRDWRRAIVALVLSLAKLRFRDALAR
jgi:hypothetical protein